MAAKLRYGRIRRTQKYKNSRFKKSAPEIVDLGGRDGRLPPKNLRVQVGGLRPHLPLCFWEVDGRFDPKIIRFPGPTS